MLFRSDFCGGGAGVVASVICGAVGASGDCGVSDFSGAAAVNSRL